MNGRGRALDNVFIERLWRTVKYEEIYLKDYPNVVDLEQGLERYFEFYSRERRHQGLGYRTPWDVFHDRRNASNNQRQRDLLSPRSPPKRLRPAAQFPRATSPGRCTTPRLSS